MLHARRALVHAALLLLLVACRALGAADYDQAGGHGDWLAVDTRTGAAVGLDEMARELARCDVVFLGEEHDNDVGHELQLELTRRLVELRPVASLSFEQIERDAQAELDRWLAGAITESEFLARTKSWPNYRKHYRPLVLLAKERGLPVVAANVPRPLASRVSRGGLDSVHGEGFAPRNVIAPPGAYRGRFAQAMGKPADSDEPGLDLWYLAQCVKDEAMAESIELALCRPPAGRLVVHYCGHFHSDFGLGTVERLARRQPDLRVGIVTTRSDSRDAERVHGELARAADYVWLVREQ
jgi:uncharacterized iron-regulated protein